jgi:hypothetical protein
MPDRAEEIMTALVAIAETLGLRLEVDRAYPVMTDPTGDGPADMPMVVVRTGDEEMDSPEAKAWGRRWIMRPSLVVFLQNKDNPNALRSQAQALWLQIFAAVNASPIPGLITRSTPPVFSKDLQPMPGRPDVLMLIVRFELKFERH